MNVVGNGPAVRVGGVASIECPLLAPGRTVRMQGNQSGDYITFPAVYAKRLVWFFGGVYSGF